MEGIELFALSFCKGPQSNPLLVLYVPTEERSIKGRRRRTFTAIALPPPFPSKKSAMRSYDESERYSSPLHPPSSLRSDG